MIVDNDRKLDLSQILDDIIEIIPRRLCGFEKSLKEIEI